MDANIENKPIRKTYFKQTWIKIIAIMLIVAVVGVSCFFGYKHWESSKQIIPANIQKQLSFSVFWPDKNAPVTVTKNTLKYSPSNGLLSYVETTNTAVELVISEQATPDTFTASPQVYSQFIQHLLEYEEFSSLNGTVYLTHPKELKGIQTAVLNANGTLMFIKPNQNLSDNTWRQIFNDIELVN